MRKRIFVLAALAAAAANPTVAADPSKDDSSNSIAWLRFIATEIRQLRRELLEDRLERQEARVKALERELQQVRAERQQSDDLQGAQAQETSQLEERLRDPEISAEQRSQLEALRAELLTRAPTDREVFARKENEASDALRRERARLAQLHQLLRAFMAATGSATN